MSPIRTKCMLVGETQRGESLLSSHLLPSPLAPGPTARLLEFKPGHVLAITLPQWPCWAQHLESHKNIIVQLLGSFVHYHKGSEKTKMLTPQGFAEAHFSDSAPSPPLYPSALLVPHCAHTDVLPSGAHGALLHQHIQSCLVKMLSHKIVIMCFVLPKSKTNNNIHSLLHTSPFQIFSSHFIVFCSQMFLFVIYPFIHTSIPPLSDA